MMQGSDAKFVRFSECLHVYIIITVYVKSHFLIMPFSPASLCHHSLLIPVPSILREDSDYPFGECLIPSAAMQKLELQVS